MSSTEAAIPGNNLKRKNEAAGEEPELEAAIKRVALEEEGEEKEDRSGSSEPETSVAVPKVTEVTLRMLCLVREASAVVGPKGETISRLKAESGARINVSENARGVPERVIYVRGTCENVAKAFGQISRVLAGEQKDSESSETTIIAVHLLIPHHLMGYVIGKHGSQLKNIESKSNAELAASPYQLLPSNDRILRVLGVPDAIHIATYYIGQVLLTFSESLQQNQRGRKTVFYQPGPAHAVLVSGTGKPSIFQMNNAPASPQDSLPRMPNGYKARRQLPRPTSNGSVNGSHSSSGSDSGDGAAPVYTAEAAANARSFIPEFQIPNVRVATTKTPDRNDTKTHNNATLQEVYIEERFVGNVIGREGKHINSIKESTGCAIYIDGPSPGATERRMTIRGTLMGSQAAILLISNKIDRDRSRTAQ